MKPIYTLADLNADEIKAYEVVKDRKEREFEKIKERYLICDLKDYLIKEIEACNNVIRQTNEAVELTEALNSIHNAGNLPTIKQPGKWDYVYSFEALLMFERELLIIENASNNSQIEFDNPLPPNIEPLPIIQPKGRPKGKQPRPLYYNLIGTDEERQKTLDVLRKLITGRKGKDVALIIYSCIEVGKMIKPTFTQLKNEFGEIGNRSGYNKYMEKADIVFTQNEIEAIKRLF